MKVMIVDDEASMRLLVQRIVREGGYEFCSASDGSEALEVFEREQPDIVILDVMMPKLNGFQVCEELRARGALLPIVFLSAKGDIVDKSIGFKAGGDEYLVKPFSPRELIIRIDAQLRQHERVVSFNNETLEAGDLKLDMRRYRVSLAGRPIDLTPREFQLLALFASHPNEVFTKEQLIEQVWGEEYTGTTTSIAVFIRRIREKIEKDPSKPEIIQTVWYIGYRFVSPESTSTNTQANTQANA